MTLVLSVHGRRTLWVLADRRLTFGGKREPRDDAIKVMELSTHDGIGVIGYAGLGLTGHGTQPSDWMSATLRGRGELSFMQSLQALANAAKRELPRHLRASPMPIDHVILVSAYVAKVGARTFSIRNVSQTGSDYRVFSHQRTNDPSSAATHLTAVGSGRDYLQSTLEQWNRGLRRRLNAYEKGSIDDLTVADFLATLNYESHLHTRDGTVGPRSLVLWRTDPRFRHKSQGGGIQFYSGTARDDQDTLLIPTIDSGGDVRAIIQPLWNDMLNKMTAWSGDEQHLPDMSIDIEDTNRWLAELPAYPDERLR